MIAILFTAGAFLLMIGACLATGLVPLGRAPRDAGWWFMPLGATLGIVGPLAILLSHWEMHEYLYGAGAVQSPYFAMRSYLFFVGGQLAGLFGLIVFAIGFADHGKRCARNQAHSAELEQLAASQSVSARAADHRPPEASGLLDRRSAVKYLLILLGLSAGLWIASREFISFRPGEAAWRIFALIVFGVSAAGIRAGLMAMRNENRKTRESNSRNASERKGAAWEMMMGGLSLAALAAFGITLMFLTDSARPFDPYTGLALLGIACLVEVIGLVLFASGFALHGLKVARQRERIAELEQVRAAMEEEVSRLENEARPGMNASIHPS